MTRPTSLLELGRALLSLYTCAGSHAPLACGSAALWHFSEAGHISGERVNEGRKKKTKQLHCVEGGCSTTYTTPIISIALRTEPLFAEFTIFYNFDERPSYKASSSIA